MDDSPSEPTDWPLALGSAPRELDELLRCGVCKDFLETPMRLPACSHLFCSGCIRGWLHTSQAAGCCPTCREPVDSAALAADSVLLAVVAAFRAARPALLAACATPVAQPTPPVRRSGRARSLPVQAEGKDDAPRHDSDDDFVMLDDKAPHPKRGPSRTGPTTATLSDGSGFVECPVCQKCVFLRGGPLAPSHACSQARAYENLRRSC